jgi:3-hydroxybutyryl-CoA dehydrogenase
MGELARADAVVEAIPEKLKLKRDAFRRLDADAAAGVILASNTSSLSIAQIASATDHPERVIGMHFFNPVPLMTLVEVVSTPQTSEETRDAVVEFAEELGKTPAEANDFPGFVSNRILMPYINEAVWALHDGVAKPEAIDTIAKLGFNHPMGPLALADLIGLDTCVAILEVLRDGLGDSRYEPCPLLREHVAAGRLGRKSGLGFYRYS